MGLAVILSEKAIMIVLILTNCLNYLDRGIIPGANGQFTDFVASSRELEGKGGASAAFGALQSAFIVGFSLTCLSVGHLIHSRSPFGISARGLFVWIFAAVVAGIARCTRSYYVLLMARMLSGVGEAGFVTVGGPYIQDAAGTSQGLWLGVFYAAIPTGTALGYGYGASIAAALNWSVAFYGEALLMLPLALCFLFSEDDGSRVVAKLPVDVRRPLVEERRETERLNISEGDAAREIRDNIAARDSPTIWEEIQICIEMPTFVWTCLAYAGYSGAVIGFSTFGPSIAVGLGLWDNMTAASLAFSGTLAISGILGTPMGGLMLDAWVARDLRHISSQNQNLEDVDTNSRRLARALDISLILCFLGSVIIANAAYALSQLPFLIYLFLGTGPLFAATAAMNVAVFESVPRCHRAFAQGVSVLVMHALGDVPTPIVIGALKDTFAPACTPDSSGRLGDKCADHQRPALRIITLGCALYFSFTILAFAIARLRVPKHIANQTRYSRGHNGESDLDLDANMDLAASLISPRSDDSIPDMSPCEVQDATGQ